jgi:opacity protein-like surface antigen
MRHFIFAAVSSVALSTVSLAAVADDQTAVQPAGFDPSGRVVCLYSVHEGMLIKRPDCRLIHAWAAEKERNRQDFRDFQRQALLFHR